MRVVNSQCIVVRSVGDWAVLKVYDPRRAGAVGEDDGTGWVREGMAYEQG